MHEQAAHQTLFSYKTTSDRPATAGPKNLLVQSRPHRSLSPKCAAHLFDRQWHGLVPWTRSPCARYPPFLDTSAGEWVRTRVDTHRETSGEESARGALPSKLSSALVAGLNRNRYEVETPRPCSEGNGISRASLSSITSKCRRTRGPVEI